MSGGYTYEDYIAWGHTPEEILYGIQTGSIQNVVIPQPQPAVSVATENPHSYNTPSQQSVGVGGHRPYNTSSQKSSATGGHRSHSSTSSQKSDAAGGHRSHSTSSQKSDAAGGHRSHSTSSQKSDAAGGHRSHSSTSSQKSDAAGGHRSHSTSSQKSVAAGSHRSHSTSSQQSVAAKSHRSHSTPSQQSVAAGSHFSYSTPSQQSVAAGSHFSYNTSSQQSVGAESLPSIAEEGQSVASGVPQPYSTNPAFQTTRYESESEPPQHFTVAPGQYEQPVPQRHATTSGFQNLDPQASLSQHSSLPSIDLRPDYIPDVDQGDYPPWHGAHKENTRAPSNRPETATAGVTMEELNVAIPGSESIPYWQGEGCYGQWSSDSWNWESAYDPTSYGRSYDPIMELWNPVFRDPREEGVCRMFDHVDFYRLAYITTVLHGTVLELEKHGNTLADIVAILNRAGRPQGFTITTEMRPKHGFTVQQVHDLFNILASLDNPNRGVAFDRVLGWVKTSDRSPKIVLRGVPEAIVQHFNYTYREARAAAHLRWGWQIQAFMFEDNGQEGENQSWFLPNAHSTQTSPEASGTQAGSSGTQGSIEQQAGPSWTQGYGGQQAGPSGTQGYGDSKQDHRGHKCMASRKQGIVLRHRDQAPKAVQDALNMLTKSIESRTRKLDSRHQE